MIPILKNEQDFLIALGNFAYYFSRLEFLLLDLCTFTELPHYKYNYGEFINLSLVDKRDRIKKFIKDNIPELIDDWKIINTEIGNINQERRFLIHGLGEAPNLYSENVKTIIKLNGKLIIKDYSFKDINKLTNQISELNTGKNGIGGVFNSRFKVECCNYYNSSVTDSLKIVFKDNGNILTEWKG